MWSVMFFFSERRVAKELLSSSGDTTLETRKELAVKVNKRFIYLSKM